MKVDDLVKLGRRRPVDLLGSDYQGSVRETVGTLAWWGVGVFATVWAARWYTIKTLEAQGRLTPAQPGFLKRWLLS